MLVCFLAILIKINNTSIIACAGDFQYEWSMKFVKRLWDTE